MADSKTTGVAALDHLRVLELGSYPAACAGFWLAGLGADVIKVEPPEGDPWRRVPPFAGDLRDRERSLPFIHFNTGKRSVAVDITSEAGREEFRRLAATADLLIEAFPPGHMDNLGLPYESLKRENPGLVLVSITPFGQTGPYRAYKADDLIIYEMGGLPYHKGGAGEDNNTNLPCWQAYQTAGVYAAVGGLLALRARKFTGRGQAVDLSMYQTMPQTLQAAVNTYQYFGTISPRAGIFGAFLYILPVKDGHVIVLAGIGAAWRGLVEWIGDPELQDERFNDRVFRAAHRDLVLSKMGSFLKNLTKEEATRQGQAHRVAIVPVNTTADYADDPQTKARGLVTTHAHPVIGPYSALARPFVLSESPWTFMRSAPRLGEHQTEVMGGKRAKVASPSSPRSGATAHRLPMDGVRILDFTRILAGPVGTMILGDFGAEVIKIESQLTETMRGAALASPQFEDVNRSKLAITLNLQSSKGRELYLDLVRQSDIVVENFAPQVMDKLGLGYETLRKVNPNVIMVRMPGIATTGPYAEWRTYGHSLLGYCGLGYLWRDAQTPIEHMPHIAYPDFACAFQLAYVLLAALEHREKVGRGQYIEIAQAEATSFLLGPAFLELFVNKRDWGPRGNTSEIAAPHGIYPSFGIDEWIVITCRDELEWEALVRALGTPEWTKDPRFATLDGRLAHKDEIDAHITEWTLQRSPHSAFHILQKAGVPAGPVQNSEDLYYCVHLRARGFYVPVEQQGWGSLELLGPVPILTETPGSVRFRAPQLGEHNKDVFHRLLGLAPEEIERWQQEKVIY